MDSSTLLVDLGNSSLKWGWLNGQAVSATDAVLYRDQSILAVLDAHWSTLPQPQKLVTAAVAPTPIRKVFERWVFTHWEIQPIYLKPSKTAVGVSCAYDPVSQLGIDRWAAMVAAYASLQRAVCVVDCGTAVTIDVIKNNGEHLGGFILPGVEMMKHALLENSGITSMQSSQASQSSPFWGIDTGSAVGHGALRAIAGLIDQALNELARVDASEPALIYTGGDGPGIFKMTGVAGEYRQDLVLEGVALLNGELK